VEQIKAIETAYRGYRFRSRLEARWAVFFDALGVAWEYEKEGYDLGDAGWYLPDFWLPDQKCWIEIKPDCPSAAEQRKCHLLVRATRQPVYLFYGNVPYPYPGSRECGEDSESGFAYTPEVWKAEELVGFDAYHWWCECLECHKVGIRFEGRSERLCSCQTGGHRLHTFDSPRLIAAYRAARSARFEHGESGAPR
jgi:hypothetical protein